MNTTSKPRGSPDTPETAPEAPRWLQDGPKCLQDGPKPVAIPRSWQASYVWEPFWGDLRMSLNHFDPIIKSLGPSSAYLGQLLQPTCSSNSFLGTVMPKLTAPKLCLTGCARPSGCQRPLFSRKRNEGFSFSVLGGLGAAVPRGDPLQPAEIRYNPYRSAPPTRILGLAAQIC